MNPIYVIINYLILAVLLFILARKTVVNMFRSRRERILSELDAAERLERENLAAPAPEAPEAKIEPDRSEIERVESEAAKKCAVIRVNTYEQIAENKRTIIEQLRHESVHTLCSKAASLFINEPYQSILRSEEGEMVEMILSKIRLTPGDMAYLRYHDVLYVTLTSAYELAPELVERIRAATDELLASVGGKTSYWVKVDPGMIGGLALRIGDTVYDCSIKEELYRLASSIEKSPLRGSETASELLASYKKTIAEKHTGLKLYEYQLGRVLTVSDGICWMDGLADIMYGEVVEFACGEYGMVLDIQPERIGCVIYGSYENIESGSRVRRVGRIASVPVGDELLGRVVNPLGRAIDGKGSIVTHEHRPVECKAPGIPDRAPVSRPLHTGIKAIDALIPIGRGQRELIIGDRQTGKTSIAIDTIINQRGKNVACIYVAIGQKETTVADIRARLDKAGALEYTTIVCATASDSASLQYIAPFAGTAMGEYFMQNGRDVLIVYDDLSKHAVAYRELSLLLHRPSGREAYPGDIFYLHSRLLERSAQLSAENGGGSMTALPIIETLAGDISSYIPTNVISITDGQIFLDADLFHEGQRPAVNVGLSVSRVGGSAQTKLLKQISGSLRMTLAQYRELLGFAGFGTDVDAETQKTLDAGAHMMAALKQGRGAPLSDSEQALLIYAVSQSHAANVDVAEMDKFERKLLDYFAEHEKSVMAALSTGAKLSSEARRELDEALVRFGGV